MTDEANREIEAATSIIWHVVVFGVLAFAIAAVLALSA